MIERVRYFLGVLHVVGLPPAALIWLVIHPWARWWRTLGPTRTYLAVLPVPVFLGALLFRIRGLLLGADLGTNWVLIGLATVFYAPMTCLEFQYWRHLSIATLIGIPELSPIEKKKGRLLREGIYGVVRHPRYLSAGLGLIGSALIANYVGFYILILLLVPVGYLVFVLEERELVDRFGEAYQQYQREVPPLIPRLRKTR